MLKKLALILLSSALLVLTACSKEDLSDYQRNAVDPDFTVFTLVEGYPTLEYIWDNMNSDLVNDKLSETMDRYADEFVRFSSIQSNIMRTNPDALVSVVKKASKALDTMLDTEEKYYYSPYAGNFYNDRGSVYRDNFYGLLERISNAETEGLRPAVMNTVRTILDYIIETKDKKELNQFMYDAIAMMEDLEREDFKDLTKMLGKMLMTANYPMYLDGGDNLITDPDDIDSNSKNTGLGNMTKGLVTLLEGSAEMVSADQELKDMLYGLLDEVPVLYSAKTDNGKDLPHVLTELISNLETYFLPADPTDIADRSDYYVDNGSAYLDSDLKTTTRELIPAIQRLILSSEREGSLIKDIDGKGVLMSAMKHLKNSGIDLSKVDVRASINEMVEKNAKGELRSPGSQELSALDHLLFTLMISNVVGFKDYIIDAGSTTPDDNWGHIHGDPTGGVLTVNDSLFAMHTTIPAGQELLNKCGMAVDTYSLVLENPAGNNIFRHKDAFSSGNVGAGQYFYLWPNYPANLLLSGNCIGDGGIPNGGASLGNPGAANGMSHMPFEPRGVGELNTGRWVMGWLARTVWEGEGPYYYADPEAEEDPYLGFKYLRPDGSIYAFVKKVNPSDPSTWIYTYPKDASYDVDLDNDGQRDTHFKHVWHTDYHLINNNGTWYSPENMQGSGSLSAGRFQVSEMMQPAHFDKRECLSQEEAMVKNFQWLIYEKKFVYVQPMRIDKSIPLADNLRTAVYVRLEGNGILGVSNVRKSSNATVTNMGGDWRRITGQWMTPTGYTADASADYVSNPGAGRIVVDMKEASTTIVIITIHLNAKEGGGMNIGLWDDVLGSGYVLPDVVGANFGPMQRMVYLVPDAIPSHKAGIDGGYWNQRSRLFPVLISLFGELHKRTNYEPPASGYAYNDSPNNRYPFKMLTDVLIPALAKPMFYYQIGQDSGDDDRTHDFWRPRVKANGAPYDFMQHDADDAADRSDPEFQPKYVRTMTSFLGENEDGSVDGILSLLNKTEMVPKLLTLLQKVSDSKFDDPETYNPDDMSTWGVRSKMFYGLEQLLTGMKVNKARAYNDSYITTEFFEKWQFKDNGIRDCDIDMEESLDDLLWKWDGATLVQGTLAKLPDTTRTLDGDDAEVIASIGRVVDTTLANGTITPGSLSIKVGTSTIDATVSNGVITGDDIDGMGLLNHMTGDIYFTLKEEPSEQIKVAYSFTNDWQGFFDLFDDLGVFIESDSKYYVYDDVIQIVKSTLNALTYDENLGKELQGSLYTLGKLLAHYNGNRWVYQGEEGFDFLYTMLKEDLPKLQKLMVDETGDNINAALLLIRDLAKANGLVDAALDSIDEMNVTDAFEWSEIFGDLGLFLHDPLLNEVDSDLWPTLANMMDDMSDAIVGSSTGDGSADSTGDALKDIYKDFGFQYNGL